MTAFLLNGWATSLVAYGTTQAAVWYGLFRGRSDGIGYLYSPVVALPLMALTGLGAEWATAGLAQVGPVLHAAARFATGMALGTMLGYGGGRLASRSPAPERRYERGTRLEETPPDRTQDGRERRREGRQHAAEISLGHVVLPLRDETKHFKLLGSTGTGKSTAIHEILGRALARGDRVVVADPDGGYLRRHYDAGRGDVILNPFDQRSVRWNPFAEIERSYDVEQLARALIAEQDGSERSWRAYARTFFTAVTRQAHEAGVDDPGELYRLLVIAEPAELRTLVHGTPAQPFLEEDNGRMFDSIRSVTSSAVGALEHVAAGYEAGHSFSVRRWVREGTSGALFMPYKAGQIAALRSAISAWMRLAIFETMDREELGGDGRERASDRLWFVVDELDALGPIDGLKDALARLRKFGGRCVLGFQSLAQVSSTYGVGDARTIVENCGNTLILRCSASEGGGTARFASQLIGEREIIRRAESHSRRDGEWRGSTTVSEHPRVETAVLPSTIEQLPDLAGYFKQASSPVWQRIRLEALTQWQRDREATRNPMQVTVRTAPRERVPHD